MILTMSPILAAFCSSWAWKRFERRTTFLYRAVRLDRVDLDDDRLVALVRDDRAEALLAPAELALGLRDPDDRLALGRLLALDAALLRARAKRARQVLALRLRAGLRCGRGSGLGGSSGLPRRRAPRRRAPRHGLASASATGSSATGSSATGSPRPRAPRQRARAPPRRRAPRPQAPRRPAPQPRRSSTTGSGSLSATGSSTGSLLGHRLLSHGLLDDGLRLSLGHGLLGRSLLGHRLVDGSGLLDDVRRLDNRLLDGRLLGLLLLGCCLLLSHYVFPSRSRSRRTVRMRAISRFAGAAGHCCRARRSRTGSGG